MLFADVAERGEAAGGAGDVAAPEQSAFQLRAQVRYTADRIVLGALAGIPVHRLSFFAFLALSECP